MFLAHRHPFFIQAVRSIPGRHALEALFFGLRQAELAQRQVPSPNVPIAALVGEAQELTFLPLPSQEQWRAETAKDEDLQIIITACTHGTEIPEGAFHDERYRQRRHVDTRKNADAIAAMESTGKIESSNAETIVLTNGKRLNMTQTNAYLSVWHRVVGHQTLGEEYEPSQMKLLGVPCSNLREKNCRELARRQSSDRKRKQTEMYKEKRKESKIRHATIEQTRVQGNSGLLYGKDKDKSGGGAAESDQPGRNCHCGACKIFGHDRRQKEV